MNLKEVIEQYELLLERAKLIVTGAPYFSYIYDDSCIRLQIDGEEADLLVPEAISDYDSCSIGIEHTKFPAYLLTMDEIKFGDWKIDQKNKYDAAQHIIRQEAILQKRDEELNTLAVLKAKYGDV